MNCIFIIYITNGFEQEESTKNIRKVRIARFCYRHNIVSHILQIYYKYIGLYMQQKKVIIK